MNDIIKFYEEFSSIQASYCGDSTDWEKCHKDLEKLERKINTLKIRPSKNSSFYYWVRRKLYEDVHNECIRVWKLTL